MRKELEYPGIFSRADCSLNRFCLFFLFFCSLVAVIFPERKMAFASEMEILTPRLGATVIGRNPEIHFVLRGTGAAEEIRFKVDKSGAILDPVVSMEGEDYIYLHFRVPVVQGKNSFTIVPEGQRVEVNFLRIQAQAQIRPQVFGKKNIYLFHQGDELPEECKDCHDLKETEIVEPVGMKKQISCGICHKNIVDRGAWRHDPTVNEQCLFCHQQSIKPWKIGFPLSNIDDICLTCHTGKKKWFSLKFRHGPLIGGCTLCHDPHGSDYRYQLWTDGSLNICIACHSDKRDLVTRKENETHLFVHGIIPGKGCVACHDPHASNNQFMLPKQINELCVSCHIRLSGVNRGHPVARHPLEGPKELRRKGRKLTCVGCHDPHGSPYHFLLIQRNFGGQICLECHNK